MKRKNTALITILCFFLLPFMVQVKECDITKVTISSMEQKIIKGNTMEIEKPIVTDKNIILNLKMFEIDDSITYDMTIKNDSKDNYIIDEDALETTDNIIKNKKKEMIIQSFLFFVFLS